MLDAFGAPVERFADSTGPLPGLLRRSMTGLHLDLLARSPCSGPTSPASGWDRRLAATGSRWMSHSSSRRMARALGGKLYGDYQSTAISEGKISGDEITFVVVAPEQAGNQINESKLRFTGSVKDGEMELTRERESSTNAGNGGVTQFKGSAKVSFRLKRLF